MVTLDRASIFVIVLTGSSAEEDLITASNYRANTYNIKLVDTDVFLQVVRSLEEFWLSVVRFPPKPTTSDSVEGCTRAIDRLLNLEIPESKVALLLNTASLISIWLLIDWGWRGGLR